MTRFLVFFIYLPIQLLAQNNYIEIDNYSKSLPKSEARTINQLAKSLTKNCKNDFQKVRSFYVWIANNVSYDFNAYKTGNVPEQSANSAFSTKRAVCQGYSELFYELCRLNQIECQVITGYSKGYGYNPNKKFKNTDHAWVATKFEGNWHLIDPTWGSGYVNDRNQYIVQFNEENFMPSPASFVLKHLPCDPIWQLLENPISFQTFEKDSLYIKQTLSKPTKSVNYLDTLHYFTSLDSINRIINSNERMIKFNPENAEPYYKLGWFYFQKAWENMSKLNNPAIQRNKSLAKPLAKQAVSYQKEALRYLGETEKRDSFYSEDIKIKKQIIFNNMESLEEILK